MKHENIVLVLQKQLSDELWESFQGDAIEMVMQTADIQTDERYQNIIQSQSFKVSEKLTPKLYKLFNDVVEKLEFKEDVVFYISNSADSNAFALASALKDKPHIININSELIEKFDDDELKFVIGHEIGHLISNNARIQNVIRFIYEDSSNVPLVLLNKISLWNKTSELTSDRFGLIACRNFEAAISSFFKLSSGLKSDRVTFSIDEYLKINDELWESISKTTTSYMDTHPINPMRIKALQDFYNSNTYHSIKKGEELPEQDDELVKFSNNLLKSVQNYNVDKLDFLRQNFIISAGLVVAALDNDLAEDEYLGIVNALASFQVDPQEYLEQILKDGNDIDKMFNDSVSQLLQNHPGERPLMLSYVIDIAIRDKKIKKKELDFIFYFGVKMLQFSSVEVGRYMARSIKGGFVPSFLREN